MSDSYYLANREKIRWQQKDYYLENRETIRAQQASYRNKNKKRINSARRKKYSDNPEKYLLRNKRCRAERVVTDRMGNLEKVGYPISTIEDIPRGIRANLINDGIGDNYTLGMDFASHFVGAFQKANRQWDWLKRYQARVDGLSIVFSSQVSSRGFLKFYKVILERELLVE